MIPVWADTHAPLKFHSNRAVATTSLNMSCVSSKMCPLNTLMGMGSRWPRYGICCHAFSVVGAGVVAVKIIFAFCTSQLDNVCDELGHFHFDLKLE
jgi:predicted DNA-binding helix-hairpin-helix protein